MNSKTTLSVTEARKDFFNLLDKVEKSNVPYTLTVKGKPKAVIMNADEYDSWMETLDIMSNPELVKGIEEGKKDLKAGRYSTFEEVFKMTADQALADKGNKKYCTTKKRK